MKVLLIDDHPLILSALQSVILSIGDDVTVVGAATAKIARDMLRRETDFDLILLDLNLGDTDGFDVLIEFRASFPGVPVVVVSASDRYSDMIKAVDAGAMGFVPKKSSQTELHEALRLVMSGGIYVPLGARALLHSVPPVPNREPHVTTFAETTPMIHHISGPSSHDTGFHPALPSPPPTQPLAKPDAASERRAGAAAAGQAEQADRARVERFGRDREGPRRRSLAGAQRHNAYPGRARRQRDDAPGRAVRLPRHRTLSRTGLAAPPIHAHDRCGGTRPLALGAARRSSVQL
jgi:DNA-binding NarL/FixJ family response regulator